MILASHSLLYLHVNCILGLYFYVKKSQPGDIYIYITESAEHFAKHCHLNVIFLSDLYALVYQKPID